MKTIPVAGAGILMLAAMQASAQSSTAALPTAALKAWQTHARSYCAEVEERYVGARFAPVPAKGISGDALPAGAGRYLAADFNGDGKPDYVFATPNGGCAGHNEGRNGPELIIEFVLSAGDGYVLDAQQAEDGYSFTLARPFLSPAWLQRRGNVDVLRYETGSVGAGRCGPLATEVVLGWNGRNVDVLEQYNARRQLVDEEGCAVRPARAAAGARGKPAAAAIPARIPLAVGYYVHVEGTFSTCAKPLGDPWYFDGKRFWEKSDFTDPRHEFSAEALRWEMVSGNRFRITYRSRDEDGNWERTPSVNEYVITGPDAFTYVGVVGQRMGSNEKHQRCPNLPASMRFFRPKR